jgi:hypothetical protein
MRYAPFVLAMLVFSCKAPQLTPTQQAVNAAFAADQELCYQSNSNAKGYVACVDKAQKCAQTSADVPTYIHCRDGGTPQ